jgi:Asp-tRNA(Asn)/Glu-tRNA(Gln) amidotransferase A subunit family amidase
MRTQARIKTRFIYSRGGIVLMKPTDEYKVCSLEEAKEFAKKRRKDLREMNTGLFDDIQINNPDRDKAWEAFIKRKDVEGWAVDKEGFPLNGFYDVWCIAWSKAQAERAKNE